MGVIYSIATAGAGIWLLALGLYFTVWSRRTLARSEPVNLRVIALHEERDDEDDVVYSPEFTILDGPHAGARHKSAHGESRALHRVGEVTLGLFDPLTGTIVSGKEEPLRRWMPVWALIAGCVLCVVAAVYRF